MRRTAVVMAILCVGGRRIRVGCGSEAIPRRPTACGRHGSPADRVLACRPPGPCSPASTGGGAARATGT